MNRNSFPFSGIPNKDPNISLEIGQDQMAVFWARILGQKPSHSCQNLALISGPVSDTDFRVPCMQGSRRVAALQLPDGLRARREKDPPPQPR